MPLSKDQIGEVALAVLKAKLAKEGVSLNPDIARERITAIAEELNVPPAHLAELMKIILSEIYTRTIEEIDKVISDPPM